MYRLSKFPKIFVQPTFYLSEQIDVWRGRISISLIYKKSAKNFRTRFIRFEENISYWMYKIITALVLLTAYLKWTNFLQNDLSFVNTSWKVYKIFWCVLDTYFLYFSVNYVTIRMHVNKYVQHLKYKYGTQALSELCKSISCSFFSKCSIVYQYYRII